MAHREPEPGPLARVLGRAGVVASMLGSVADTELGAAPEAGDLVRIAYRVRDGRHVAHRLMNITRQAELSGKASSSH